MAVNQENIAGVLEEVEKEDEKNVRYTASGLTKTEEFTHSEGISEADMEKRRAIYRQNSKLVKKGKHNFISKT